MRVIYCYKGKTFIYNFQFVLADMKIIPYLSLSLSKLTEESFKKKYIIYTRKRSSFIYKVSQIKYIYADTLSLLRT